MSSGFFREEPTATWNPALGVWETAEMSLGCEHSVPYSAIFPRSGTVRAGKLYLPARQEPLIAGNGSSSSLLPTPTAQLNEPADWKPGVDWWLQSRATRNLEGVVTGNTPLLATPNARDWKGSTGWKEQKCLPKDIALLERALEDAESDGEAPGIWGRYTAAIERWEKLLGRPAPAPTVPGKNGPRLNPELPEFMQGFPAGWITGVPGLSREDQLRLAGNSVCPQQGALALRLLLERSGRKIS